MQRVNDETREIDKHGTGKDGFTDGDAELGVAPTIIEAYWFDSVQEELANAVEGSGRSLDPSDLAQLAAVLRDINAGAFGDGSDGTYIDSSAALSLTRDMYWDRVTLGGTARIVTNGFRIFCSGTLTLFGSAQINAAGTHASGSTAGEAPYATGTSLGAGGDGGGGHHYTTAHTTPDAVPNSLGGNGGAGGNSTNVDGSAYESGDPGGVATPPTSGLGGSSIRHAPGYLGYVQGSSGRAVVRGGGGGGGGATGAATNMNGGGGGGGGGVISIVARRIVTEAGTTITARGGNGAPGLSSSVPAASGGGGGGGGVILIASRWRDIAGTVSVAGGVGAATGALGSGAGADGSPGTIVYFTV